MYFLSVFVFLEGGELVTYIKNNTVFKMAEIITVVVVTSYIKGDKSLVK